MSMSFRPRSLALATVPLAALLLAGCSAGANAETTGGGGNASGDKAPVTEGASQVKVTMQLKDGSDQCVPDFASAESGPVTFSTENKDSTALSEVELLSEKRILGERENIAPGLTGGTFTVTLDPGTYQIYCPGASPESVDFTVTGERKVAADSSIAGLLDEGAKGYAEYVSAQTESAVAAVKELQAAVDSGDVAAAEQAYAAARPFYERIEPVAESFPDLDPAIDLREADLAEGETWTGFHTIEKDIFTTKKITDATKKNAAQLVTDVEKLLNETKNLSYQPEDLANGASGLLEEIQNSKITGEEEIFSQIDLVDFAANVEGAEQAFVYLRPALTKIDEPLTKTIDAEFEKVKTTLDGYKDSSELGGYQRYTPQLRASDGAELTATIQSLQAPMARIAEKVATAR